MLNQYRITRTLGKGTHGTVKYGEDMSKDPNAPEHQVAIKIIKRMANRKRLPRADGRERTNTALARIRYEVAVMKRCHHDHIVRLIEVIDDPRSHNVFLVMEYLEGGEIKWRGQDRPILTLGQTRRIVRDVLLGLEYLHYMGIIHRDIKPANMLWTKGRARVKLTDFGVAHFSKPLAPEAADDTPYADSDDHLHKTEGTPAFYAPEQAYNQNGLPVPMFPPGQRPPGAKSDQIFPMTKELDVWAFGVSIYCFLFGCVPYWGENVHALCKEIIENEYTIPPTATCAQLPIDSDDDDLREAIKMLKGMMTKPVHLRLRLAQAKTSPWLTSDLEDPASWLKETDPEAKEAIFIGENEPKEAVTTKQNSFGISGLMQAFRFRKKPDDVKSMKGASMVSLENSTHRPLPPKPRSLYRPSADQPASPVDAHAAMSAASSPTGTTYFGESYFGVRVQPKADNRVGGLSRMMSSIFRRSKKSSSAEAIMTKPAAITPIVPRVPAHDSSACSSPPGGPGIVRPESEEELDPLFITYSSDDDEEDEYDVQLVGFGGYGGENSHLNSNGLSPSDGSRSFPAFGQFNPDHSVIKRTSTTTSEPPQRVYDPAYQQHTHRSMEDFNVETITSTPSSPRQGTIYIPGASQPPPPRTSHPAMITRSIGQNNLASEGEDDESDEEGDVVISIKTRNRRHNE